MSLEPDDMKQTCYQMTLAEFPPPIKDAKSVLDNLRYTVLQK